MADGVRGQSFASDALFRDLMLGVGGVGIADQVYFPSVAERKLVRIEVVVPFDNQRVGIERWTISHGPNLYATYTVRMVPDGEGGTNFGLSLEK